MSFVDHLDEIDPDWRLSEQARCERDGVEFQSYSTRMAEKRWQIGLLCAGWTSTDEALAWMNRIGGGPPALAIKMDMPQIQVWSRLKRDGVSWQEAQRSGASFETHLKAATVLAKRDGDLGRAPELLRDWLRERVTVDTEPWVNAMLDELDPQWRLR